MKCMRMQDISRKYGVSRYPRDMQCPCIADHMLTLGEIDLTTPQDFNFPTIHRMTEGTHTLPDGLELYTKTWEVS
jgi:hypothetical protein